MLQLVYLNVVSNLGCRTSRDIRYDPIDAPTPKFYILYFVGAPKYETVNTNPDLKP
jgi:hypothetical protein